MTEKIELPGLSDYDAEIEKVYEELETLQREERQLSNAEELEELEGEIRRLTDRLGGLLLGKKNPRVIGFSGGGSGRTRTGEKHSQAAEE
jgi:predicted nuclease with TOPRIM domain